MFGNHVRLFCSENNLILSSETHLPGGTFTHYSEAWHTTSWLDHCISTSDGNEIINSISIDYSINNADHLPVCIDLALQSIITESMSKASEAIFDKNNCAGTNRRNDTHSIPGWNEHVDELHNIAGQSFVEWIVDVHQNMVLYLIT